jgi:serine/threonine protein kinase
LLEIGVGSFAIVYLCKWKSSQVALKLFKDGMFSTELGIKNLEKEMKFIGKIRNSNIINFYGFVFEKSKYGIVLEYCNEKKII